MDQSSATIGLEYNFMKDPQYTKCIMSIQEGNNRNYIYKLFSNWYKQINGSYFIQQQDVYIQTINLNHLNLSNIRKIKKFPFILQKFNLKSTLNYLKVPNYK